MPRESRRDIITRTVVEALRHVGKRHGLPVVYTGPSPVSPARLSGAGWDVAGFADGSAGLRLHADAEIDVLRAALVLRDAWRELTRAFGALPEDMQRYPLPDVADVSDLLPEAP